jgi:hypothetical protein
MSIESGTKGDDEGRSGVVMPSHLIGGVVVPSAATLVSTSRDCSPIPTAAYLAFPMPAG